MSKKSVKSLGSGKKEGGLTKQGGSVRSWKKRWFVLKGDTLFYFEGQDSKDIKGSITLEPTSICQTLPAKSSAKKHMFHVEISKRDYPMFASDEKTAEIGRA